MASVVHHKIEVKWRKMKLLRMVAKRLGGVNGK